MPDTPLIARVRPANVASQRVAVRAGLRRARHLDAEGYDGFDWIYVARPADGTPSPQAGPTPAPRPAIG
ncbi:hypothetical protein HEK616_19300 [Streptomyces nigrescens]|uniref:Acetyltransferase n=1 Tax=Streptomyces nigrescens TaxID=1920 RepID=A0ABM7ZQ07_STRNI|nr:hypothetical protein [Streptomyces nigrescens]BDM68443.1 hypothetical protein HEK616_19300 [Streptomyces nigrescens]